MTVICNRADNSRPYPDLNIIRHVSSASKNPKRNTTRMNWWFHYSNYFLEFVVVGELRVSTMRSIVLRILGSAVCRFGVRRKIITSNVDLVIFNNAYWTKRIRGASHRHRSWLRGFVVIVSQRVDRVVRPAIRRSVRLQCGFEYRNGYIRSWTECNTFFYILYSQKFY